ncbi:HK97-gp10 family putative phage morphogenesis protein [Lysinibacillus sphaericus]|uniref:HK97-gp10 family putative phage morphogenesis protein n=1 Tax=Lysinibacillus sphaericus TaxID=1421 RepID=UPI003D02030C
MSGLNIEMHGLEALQREIQQRLNPESIIEPTLIKSAEYFRDQLEENVYRFGIKQRTGISKKSMVIAKKVVDNSIYVGVSNQSNDAFYLYFHEWGTSKMPARPFMRPTFENEMTRIINIMATELRARMDL